MKTHSQQTKPLGSFASSPIAATTEAGAREVLSRTYALPRFSLTLHKTLEHPANPKAGYPRSFIFFVCPVPFACVLA